MFRNVIEKRLIALGAACFAGSFLAVKLDTWRQRRRDRACARAMHPSAWSGPPSSDRGEIFLEAESNLVGLRLAGRIDQTTYQRRMAQLAMNDGAAVLTNEETA